MRAATLILISLVFLSLTAVGASYFPFDGVTTGNDLDLVTINANTMSATLNLHMNGIQIDESMNNGEATGSKYFPDSIIKAFSNTPVVHIFQALFCTFSPA